MSRESTYPYRHWIQSVLGPEIGKLTCIVHFGPSTDDIKCYHVKTAAKQLEEMEESIEAEIQRRASERNNETASESPQRQA